VASIAILLTNGDTHRIDSDIDVDPSGVGHREDSAEESDDVD